ncbi:uncharacterized protein G2W53_016821 [Senna tora]|uniref:Uncharacterized protein n=1 Tax=Senna tora TaxID=362788 RepID=A0A834TQY2_9FABA|nr:uncharacterized protein G2W53_016821 [Senna tora]
MTKKFNSDILEALAIYEGLILARDIMSILKSNSGRRLCKRL